MGTIWETIQELSKDGLVIEAVFAVILFTGALLVFRRIRKTAEELERRKALAEYVRGLDEFLNEEHATAVKTLETVLERDPENVEARIALGDCYRELGDAAEAKKHHHHVHKVFGHELARNFVSLGYDEIALKNFDRAAAAFEEALQRGPGDRDARSGLAQALAEGGDPVGAAEQLRLVYPGGPGNALPLKERRTACGRFCDAGAASLAAVSTDLAIGFYTEALAFEKTSVRARTGLLRAAAQLGDDDRARGLIEEHLGALRELASTEGTLFEPGRSRPPADLADSIVTPDAAESSERSDSLVPATITQVGALVAAVDDKTARYVCAACGVLAREYTEKCGSCGEVGSVEASEALQAMYTMPMSGFREVVDEVEETSAYVQALARKAALGNSDALEKLCARGTNALYEVFAALPGIEARRYLGEAMAQLGPAAAREVQQCHSAQRASGTRGGGSPADEFAAAFYLALGKDDHDAFLGSIGENHDAAVAGAMADPRLSETVRDAAMSRLQPRVPAVLGAVIEAVGLSGDAGGVERAARLVNAGGRAAVDEIEKRFFRVKLLGRLFGGKTGSRRRAAADVLARCGLSAARETLGRVAANEKDDALRAHYVAARERASKEPAPDEVSGDGA
ncbi:MAG: tetratricopeptide repeat protein [Planctomycetota bacterium]